jgi:ferric iron reductase protein FhuF
MFKVTVKTQQECINILLSQHVSVLLDHLQVSIQIREENLIFLNAGLKMRYNLIFDIQRIVRRYIFL